MDKLELRMGAFNGAPFFVTEVNTSGGKANSIKKIPDSNKQKVEDLGNKDNSYKVSGFIAARYVTDAVGNVSQNVKYIDMRSALLAAFAIPDGGIFINPFGDDVTNAVPVSWSIRESTSSLGLTPVSLTLEISSVDEVLDEVGPSEDEVVANREEADRTVHQEIENSYEVDTRETGNFTSALDKVNGVIDAVLDAASGVDIPLDKLDEFYRAMSETANKVTELVSSPQRLADSIVNMVQAIGGLGTSVIGTIDAYKTLFDFGDSDPVISPFTSGLDNRRKNNDIVNDAVQTLSLSKVYELAAQIEYDTTDDVDAMNVILEDQFQKLKAESELVQFENIRSEHHEVSHALENLRQATQEFLDVERLNAQRVIEIETLPVSARVLAYRYYGSSELGVFIAKLNNLNDSDRLEGTIKIVTS